MEQKMIQLPPMSIVMGSPNNFRGVPEPGDRINRPLMVNAWSQTTVCDFSYLNEIQNLEQQSQREMELEKKIKLLEENLKAHTELLSQIHATSARTTALLSQQNHQNQQQQPQTQQYNNICFSQSNTNNFNANTNTSIRTSQPSPKIVNAINPIQQVSCSPAESVKYTIIAEGTNCNNDEPIEIQLAEDDGALNLNSSADSGRLEICLAPEENIEIKTEYTSANNNTMTVQHQTTPIPTEHINTPSEHHFIKRRKLAAEQQEIQPKYVSNDETILSYKNSQHNQPKMKRRSSGNSLLKTHKTQINNSTKIQQSTPIQNATPSPANNYSNSSHHSFGSDSPHVSFDMDNVMVSIGPNNTRIPAKLYENMNWTSASIATRKLLMAIFDRKVLATHSMTGKPSPAFKDHGKPVKQMLDPLVIADIIFAVTRKCNVSDKEVRNAITTKCADENKMMKLQMNKRNTMKEMNKENIVG